MTDSKQASQIFELVQVKAAVAQVAASGRPADSPQDAQQLIDATEKLKACGPATFKESQKLCREISDSLVKIAVNKTTGSLADVGHMAIDTLTEGLSEVHAPTAVRGLHSIASTFLLDKNREMDAAETILQLGTVMSSGKPGSFNAAICADIAKAGIAAGPGAVQEAAVMMTDNCKPIIAALEAGGSKKGGLKPPGGAPGNKSN